MAYLIRRLTVEDAGKMSVLAKTWHEEIKKPANEMMIRKEFQGFLDTGYLVGAFHGMELVGFIALQIETMLWYNKKCAVENMVFIHPDHRGKKIFNKLVTMSEAVAKAHECDFVFIMPNKFGSDNPKEVVQKLSKYGYKSHGYIVRKDL